MKILILGHTGKMGRALWEVFRNHDISGMNSSDFDANELQTDFIFPMILSESIDVIINCVAFMSIDRCEVMQNKALRINTIFPSLLAQKTADAGIVFVHFSTDAVFPDGGPFSENDLVGPSNWYGRTKSFADIAIPLINPKHYICRLPILFGESDSNQFVEKMLAKNGNLQIADDIISSPTYSLDAARAVKNLLEQQAPYGLYHVTNSGYGSLYDLMLELVYLLDLDKRVTGMSYKHFPFVGKKNTHTPLVSNKLLLRHWKEAAKEYCDRLKGEHG